MMILQVIETADAAELNYLIAHSNCANLLEVASEETVNMLTSMYGSLKQLTVLSRYEPGAQCTSSSTFVWILLPYSLHALRMQLPG